MDGRRSLYALFQMAEQRSTNALCKSSHWYEPSSHLLDFHLTLLVSLDGLLSRRYRQKLHCRQGRHSTHLRVYQQRCRHRHRRGLNGCLSRPNHFLLEGTEQEEAQQPPVVLQCIRSIDQAQRYALPCEWSAVSCSACITVCVLLDVGTKPTGTSIYELWKCNYAPT